MRKLPIFILLFVSLISFAFGEQLDLSKYTSSNLREIQEALESQGQLEMYTEDSLLAIDTTVAESIKLQAIESVVESIYNSKNYNFLLPDSQIIFQFGYDNFKHVTASEMYSSMHTDYNYIIGPGDNIVVSISGELVLQQTIIVDKNGKIFIENIGDLNVWGKNLLSIKKDITNAVNKKYSNINVDVTLGQLRNIQVYVVGEVVRPGIYNVSAMMSPLQLIYIAGGIKKTGSLRNIKLISQKRYTLDFYRLILKGVKYNDIFMNSGDIIYIPPIGKTIAFMGAVKTPGIYEIKKNESINTLLGYAGGILPVGNKNHLQLVTFRNSKRITKDYIAETHSKLLSKLRNVKCNDGDIVSIPIAYSRIHKYVKIYGEVKQPGKYAFVKNMNIKELIKKSGGFTKDSYMEKGFIFRYIDKTRDTIFSFTPGDYIDKKLDIELKEWDSVYIFSSDEILPSDSVFIYGAVKNPGTYSFHKNISLENLIFLAGGYLREANEDSCELYKTIEKSIKFINLKDSTDINIKLSPFDVVNIKYDKNKERLKTAVVAGNVKYPGIYAFKDGETLNSLIKRTGGFTDNAFKEGVVFIRKSVSILGNKARRDLVNSLNIKLLEEQTSMSTTGEMTAEDLKLRMQMLQQKKSLIWAVSNIKTPGRVVIDIDNERDINISLEDGDSIYVPEINNTVQIVGAVYNPAALIYNKGKSVRYYLNQVGGLKSSADRRNMYILRASGIVDKNMRKVTRGDAIIIPEKFVVRTDWRPIIKDIVTIVSQLAIATVSIYSIIK